MIKSLYHLKLTIQIFITSYRFNFQTFHFRFKLLALSNEKSTAIRRGESFGFDSDSSPNNDLTSSINYYATSILLLINIIIQSGKRRRAGSHCQREFTLD